MNYLRMTMISIGFLLAILATVMPINGFVSSNLLMMKSNSVSHFYIKFSSVLHNQTRNLVPIIPADANQSDPSRFHLSDLSIVPNKTSITLDDNYTVVDYTVTVKNNLKGLFAFYLPDCTRMPLAVGLDGSKIDPYLLDEMTTVHGCTYSPQVKSKLVGADSVENILSAQQGIPKHTPTVSFDQKTYEVGDTATITVNDPNLDTDNDLVVTYSSVLPVDTLSNPQDPATDTVGQAGLGTYSDGTPIGMLFDIQWGQQDRRWSNSDVPTNKITTSCWGGANSNTGTPGRFATGLAASGFFLTETSAGSGVFQGTFEIPDRVCLAPAGTTGGPGVSAAVNGMDIKASYYFRDESDKLAEVSDTAGIRGKPSGGVRL
ncbi:MAG: hypothetical protein KGI27_08770, partial [Thaumarchaeota archaeon]|nr:hypothetical protein [Nitrososphaerota archaeon]